MEQRAGIGVGDDGRRAGFAALSASLLRMSVPGRLAIAAVMALSLWAAMFWALA